MHISAFYCKIVINMTSQINHIGFILDGNRRYAKENNVSYEYAYQKAADVVTDLVKWLLVEDKANVLSVYALSLDNVTKRSTIDLEPIYTVQTKAYKQWFESKLMLDNSIKVQFVGETQLLPKEYKRACLDLEEQTKNCTKKKFYVLVAYSGQLETIKAMEYFHINEPKDYNQLKQKFMKHLSIKEAVELVIRTAGEQRLSDFLPIQTIYAEFIFLDKYFPALTKEDIEKMLSEFSRRKRKFGE